MKNPLISQQLINATQAQQDLVDAKELARRLGIKVGWIRQNVRVIPHYKAGRLVRFNVQEVMESFKSG